MPTPPPLTRRLVMGGLAAATSLRGVAAQAKPVRMAASSNTLAFGGLHIAREAGLFRAQALDLTTTVMDSGSAAITALLAGSVDLAAAGPGEALAARARGQPIVIMASLYRGLSGSLVLSQAAVATLGVARDAPIAARLHALNGLVIAAPSATSAYLHPFRSGAAANGAQVRFVYMSQPAMVAALSAGAVQGIVAGAPFSTTPVQDGSGVLWISGPRRDLPDADLPATSACVQATEDYVRANPDTVRRLRAALDALAVLIKDHPDQARAMLERAYPQIAPATLRVVFDDEAANWATPDLTAGDIAREIAIQKQTGAIAGVGAIAPDTMLVPAARQG